MRPGAVASAAVFGGFPLTNNRPAAIKDRALAEPAKKSKNVVDTCSRRQKITRNAPAAKAILPEPRSVQKANSYQYTPERKDYIMENLDVAVEE